MKKDHRLIKDGFIVELSGMSCPFFVCYFLVSVRSHHLIERSRSSVNTFPSFLVMVEFPFQMESANSGICSCSMIT